MSNLPPLFKKQVDRWYPLKAHPEQIRFDSAIDNGVRFCVVPAGRRCLAEGTLVATPNGGVPIEKLKVGDVVIGFNGKDQEPTTVVKTYSFGRQPVWMLFDGSRELFATGSHKLWASHWPFVNHFKRITIDDLTYFHRVKTKDGYTRFEKVEQQIAPVYDIMVGNDTNLYYLDNGVVTSNSGKTERAKRIVAKQALINPNEKYFCCAPTNTQSVKIFWDDMLKFTFSYVHKQKPNKSLRIIYLPNGTEIHIFGLDAPSRFEGINWTGGTIDEIADVRGEAIDAHIMPALNTVTPDRPDYRPWCLFTGVPDGLNHYYDMAEYARTSGDPDWAYFHWKSAEILPPDIIASAKRSMSLKQYKQEYEASFETAGGKIYEDYSERNHTGAIALPHEVLHWSHDQNYTPLSSCIAVIRNNVPYFVDEIVLESAVSRQSALEFVEKYKDHENKQVYVYGDPAGKAGEKHGHKSDYTEIEAVLREHGWSFERRVKPAHPSIKDRQNAVRAKIQNAAGEVFLYVNPVKAPWCHKALATCQFKDGSSFQEDDKNKYQHISTAIGYFIDRLYPVGQSAKKSKILSGHY